MPFTKGMKRPANAGRKAGSPISIKSTVAEICAANGYNPYQGMLEIANDPNESKSLRLQAHAQLAKYIHPALSSVQHSGDAEKPIQMIVRSVLDDPRSL